MRFIDLFCGAGLFSEGMAQAGHTPLAAYDIWPLAVKSYNLNRPGIAHVQDITQLDISTPPHTDMIIGSPPCTSFSTANYRRLPDPALIRRFLEAVRDTNPHYWILENVPGAWEYVRREATYVGVRVPTVAYYRACDFGAAQLRRRLFCGDFPRIMAPAVRKHKVCSMNGAIARQQMATHSDSRYMAVRRLSRYFAGTNPSVSRIKEEMGLRQDYALAGMRNQQIMQLVNGVYVPLVRRLGEAITC